MKRTAILLTLWLTLCGFTKVQDCSTTILSSSGSLTASCTLSGVAAGDTIVVCPHNGSGTVLVTDNNGGSYSALPGGNTAMQISVNHAAGNTTITEPNTSTGVFQNVTAAEYSGLGRSPTFDGAGASSTYTARTQIVSGSASTSGNNPELAVLCGFVDSVQTPTGLTNTGGGTPSAYSNQGQTSSGGGETNVGAWQSVSTSGPFGAQWTVTTAGTFGVIGFVLPSTSPTLPASVCPNGAGQPGYCDLGADTWSNITTYYVCPASTSCTMTVTDAASCPAAGGTPTGGSSGHPCSIAWTGSAWVTD